MIALVFAMLALAGTGQAQTFALTGATTVTVTVASEAALSVAAASPLTAAGIPISLDGHRTVATGADGHYLFAEVAEGPHEVALSASGLPAEYDPGSPASAKVLTRRAAPTGPISKSSR